MSELEDLIAEKRRIESRIKELKTKSVSNEHAKLYLDHFATEREDEWCVSIKVHKIDIDDRDVWRSIIRGTDKQKVITEIIPLIDDLTKLYQDCMNEFVKEGN